MSIDLNKISHSTGISSSGISRKSSHFNYNTTCEFWTDFLILNFFYTSSYLLISIVVYYIYIVCITGSFKLEIWSITKIMGASLLSSLISLFVSFLQYVFVGPKHKLDKLVENVTNEYKIQIPFHLKNEPICKFICRIMVFVVVSISIVPSIYYSNSLKQGIQNIENLLDNMKSIQYIPNDDFENNKYNDVLLPIDYVDMSCAIFSYNIYNGMEVTHNPPNLEKVKWMYNQVGQKIFSKLGITYDLIDTLIIEEQDITEGNYLKYSVTHLKYTVDGVTNDEIFLTFKGTETIQDMVIDINLIPVEIQYLNSKGEYESIYLHGGFYNGIKNSLEKIYYKLEFIPLQFTKLNICGHSLGGASALIMGYFQLLEQNKPDYKRGFKLNRISTIASPNVIYDKEGIIHEDYIKKYEIIQELFNYNRNFAFYNDVVPNLFSHYFDMTKFEGDFDHVLYYTMWLSSCGDHILCLYGSSYYWLLDKWDNGKFESILKGMVGEFADIAKKYLTLNNVMMDPYFVDQRDKSSSYNSYDPNLHGSVMYLINLWMMYNKHHSFQGKLKGTYLLSPLVEKMFVQKMGLGTDIWKE